MPALYVSPPQDWQLKVVIILIPLEVAIMTTLVDVEQLNPVTFKDTPVITTELLAQVYGTEPVRLRQNTHENKSRFIVGKHYFLLEGDALREFKHKVALNYSVKIARSVRSLILWTERGAARHAKMLETEQAWEVFEKLEDCYFRNALPLRKSEPVTTFPNPASGYDSRMMHYMRCGMTVASMPILPDQIITSVGAVIEMLELNGYIVVNREKLVGQLMVL
jgi:hypothetical protein